MKLKRTQSALTQQSHLTEHSFSNITIKLNRTQSTLTQQSNVTEHSGRTNATIKLKGIQRVLTLQ